MLTLEELKKYLEKEREDLIELREKNDISDEGKGQLEMINAIFEKMGWETEENNQDNKTKDLNNHYLLKDNGNNKSNNNGDSKKNKEWD